MPLRRIAPLVAGTTIAFAIALAAIVLWWRWTPPPPVSFSGFDALAIYPWVELALNVLMGTACAIAVILIALRRRKRAGSIVGVTLLFAVLAGTAAIHLPLW